MTSLTKPNDFVGVFGPPKFNLTVDSTDTIEVKIMDAEDTLLGTKRLDGSLEYDINVANYANRLLDVVPLAAGECGFVVPQEGRMAQIEVVVDDDDQTSAGTAIITASRKVMEQQVLLSMLPLKREIATNECDELAFLMPVGTAQAIVTMKDSNGMFTTLDVYQISNSESRLVSFVVDMADIATILEEQFSRSIDEYVSFEVSIGESVLEYEIVSGDSSRKRLCWWNDYGAVDYYSFYESGDSKITAQKYVVKTEQGYKTECTEIQTQYELCSKSMSRSEAEGVSKVIYAQAVWLVDEDGSQAVCVDTSYIEQKDDELPTVCIEISQTGLMDS